MNAFLLDTNVLSELMRPQPAAPVLAWFAARAASTMYSSAITQAEILTGIALLPFGQRQQALAQAAQTMFSQDFAAGRLLPFDRSAAEHYALIVATRRAQGRPISTEDAQIAAIAVAAKLPLLTRNTKDFTGIAHLARINPWDETENQSKT